MLYNKYFNQVSLYGSSGKSNKNNVNTSYSANTGSGALAGPTPVNLTPYSFQGGNLVGGPTVTIPPVSPTGSIFAGPNLSYGANVIQIGAGAGGGNAGGVTDEGAVIGNPNVNNSTFNNITDGGSPTYAQMSAEVGAGTGEKVDLSYSGNAGTGTEEDTVTPPVETPPVEEPPAAEEGTNDDGTIDGYYDYLKTEMPEHLQGIYNDTIVAIDKANANIIAEINASKDRGVIDADTAYKHNLSAYGAKNEALRDMGLAGSGYSEYLDSQAYAAYRGEVQGVKASALAAENEANSNAENAKLEAKKALNESTLYYDNLAEEHLENKYSEILKGAGDGTYSKEQIENLAGYYGFTPEQIATLTGSADSYETERLAEEERVRGENFLKALADVKAGYYDEEDIPTLVDQFGFTPEQSAQLVTEAQQYKQNTYAANTNTASGNVTSDTTDDEIQDMVDQDLIDDKGAEELKEDRKQAQINEINDYIEIGDYSTALKLADKYYNNGNGTIDKDTYQKAYFDFWTNGISSRENASVDDIMQDIADIENQKSAGKLSAADANSLLTYLKSTCSGSVSCTVGNPHNVFGTELKTHTSMVEVTLNGTTYKDVEYVNNVDDKTKKALNALTNNTTQNGTFVKIGDQIYMYRKYDKETDACKNGWVSIKVYNFWTSAIGSDNEAFYEAYNTALNHKAKPSTPSHSTDTTSTSSSSSGSTGGGGGGGRTAGGYNGSGMSVRVHQMQ